MKTRWLRIRYRDFHDFPRIFVVEYQGVQLIFDCPFRDDRDEYDSNYTVYRIDDETRDQIDPKDWADIARVAERIGVVPTEAVTFDKTKRRKIKADIFELL